MKKSLLIAFALLTMSLVVMAVPAKKGVYKTLTLSDGTTVRAMLVGDEHGHFWRADDGQTYVQKNGIYQTVDTKDIVEKARVERVDGGGTPSGGGGGTDTPTPDNPTPDNPTPDNPGGGSTGGDTPGGGDNNGGGGGPDDNGGYTNE